MFLKNVDELIKKYSKMKKHLEENIYRLPRGGLRTNMHGSECYFYWLDPVCEKKNGIYLRKNIPEDMKMIQDLAEKKYCKEALDVVDKDLQALASVKKKMSWKTVGEVYDEMNEGLKQFITPLEISNEEAARRWKETRYSKNPRDFGDTRFFANDKTQVRSKSELIIANRLLELDIPFKYEKLYTMKDGNKYYPDFTVLNAKTGVVYIWEHYGLMDVAEYRNKALKKIEMYTEYERENGVKFIATFESNGQSLNPDYINNIIENNFR